MTERAELQVFDRSTFTHIGRNERAVAELLWSREKDGLPTIRRVILLGSGFVEPFTIAALPWMKDAIIHAVDVNEHVVGFGEYLAGGGALPWEVVGLISRNRERKNNDFTDPQRIKNGLEVLKELGCLYSLGDKFDEKQMQVSPAVAARVNFVHSKALEALNSGLANVNPDFIGAFFLLLNINKDPDAEKGVNYSRALVERSLEMLEPKGILMIGDTSLNLPITYDQITKSTKGVLNLSGMVHAVNFGKGVTSSHYVVASQMEDYPGLSTWTVRARTRILANPLFKSIGVQEVRVDPDQVSERSSKELNIGFIGPYWPGDKGESWNSSIPGVAEAIKVLVPNSNDEVSEDTVFPAQKPHLERSR